MRSARLFLIALLAMLLALSTAYADDAAAAIAQIEPVSLADPNVAGFGVDKYFIGAAVDTSALESEGFALDDYYSPDTYYSKEVDMNFPFGLEVGRLDLGVEDGHIYRIIYEINNMWPTEGSDSLESRDNVQQVLEGLAAVLDARYSDWTSEQWAHEDPNLHVDVMDMYNADYALSFRISMLANTLIYTTAADRETKADWPDSAEAPPEAQPEPDVKQT
jgi:hypothetical protein